MVLFINMNYLVLLQLEEVTGKCVNDSQSNLVVWQNWKWKVICIHNTMIMYSSKWVSPYTKNGVENKIARIYTIKPQPQCIYLIEATSVSHSFNTAWISGLLGCLKLIMCGNTIIILPNYWARQNILSYGIFMSLNIFLITAKSGIKK